MFLRPLAWLLPLAIVVYATYLCWGASREYFNPDEIANMYRGGNRTAFDLILSQLGIWTNYDRLLGILYFKAAYNAFGFHVLPWRLATFAVCAINLALLNSFLKRLFDAPVRWLALLIAAFHGAMWSIYASAGTMFDVLCLTFTLIALLYYAASREKPVRNWRLVALGLATNCAIASKEVGFAVPLLLTAYELLIVPRQLAGYDWRDRLSAIPRLGVSYGVALVAGIGSMLFYDVMRLSAYAPSYTWERFLETTKAHAESVAFKTVSLPGSTWVAVMIGLLLVALAVRSRTAIFGWVYYNIAVLPLAFSIPRFDGYVVYVAYVGWAIYFAGLLEVAYRRVPWRAVLVVAAAALVIWGQVWQRKHVMTRFGPGGGPMIQSMVEQVRAHHPRFRNGERILLVNDPTGEDHFQPMMLLHLAYGDRSLVVEKSPTVPPDLPHDHVLVFDAAGKMSELTSH